MCMNEWPDEKVHKVKSRRVPSVEDSVLEGQILLFSCYVYKCVVLEVLCFP
jgi:hypothetical protein